MKICNEKIFLNIDLAGKRSPDEVSTVSRKYIWETPLVIIWREREREEGGGGGRKVSK